MCWAVALTWAWSLCTLERVLWTCGEAFSSVDSRLCQRENVLLQLGRAAAATVAAAHTAQSRRKVEGLVGVGWGKKRDVPRATRHRASERMGIHFMVRDGVGPRLFLSLTG